MMPFYPRPYISKRIYDGIFSILARDECRAVLPHSKNAFQQMIIRNQHNRCLEEVLKKNKVVYPAVRDYEHLSDECLTRKCTDGVSLLFVGTQFFIKGGHLAIASYSKLRKRYPVSMTVVSSLSTEDWTTHRPPQLASEWRTRLKELGIAHYPHLDNLKVRELMARSDILVLPSIDETFGFVLLEAMATGMAVVATGIRAIPEIVDDNHTGILLPCSRDEESRLVRTGVHEEDIRDRLTLELQNLLDDPIRLRKMKVAARERYIAKFSIGRLAHDLSEVYAHAANG